MATGTKITRSGIKNNTLLQPLKSKGANPTSLHCHLPLKTKIAGTIKDIAIKVPCTNNVVTVSKAKITDTAPDAIGNIKITKHHKKDLQIANTLYCIINFLSYISLQILIYSLINIDLEKILISILKPENQELFS